MSSSCIRDASEFSDEGFEHLLRCVKTMIGQSESAYSCSDYFRRRSKKGNGIYISGQDGTSELVIKHGTSIEHNKVDTVCREKMVGKFVILS